MFKKIFYLISLFLLFILLSLFERTRTSGGKLSNCQDCNVILIGADALRADHLGVYGYDRPTSPNIDYLAKNAVLFNSNYSQSITTTPSFMSIFTSLYPTDHGVLVTSPDRYSFPTVAINPDIKTLPQILKSNGYYTKALITSSAIPYNVGFGRGFDEFQTIRLQDARQNLLSWLNKNSGKKFFAFFHNVSPHAPYNPPPELRQMFEESSDRQTKAYTSGIKGFESAPEMFSKVDPKNPQDVRYLQNLYDASIRDLDNFMGELLDSLKKNNLLDKTIVIFIADHGEEFQDHGEFEHIQFYQEIQRVPLVIKSPSIKSAITIDQITRSIDVMPTILDLLKIKTNAPMRGTSLLPIIRDSKKDLSLPVVTVMGVNKSIIEKGYKFIDQRSLQRTLQKSITYEFYNLESDKKEQTNLIGKNIQIEKNLMQLYTKTVGDNSYYKAPIVINESGKNKDLDDLKTLGY